MSKSEKDIAIIETIKQRLIQAYHSLAIYLFGSYAWGKPNQESDLDFLVVVEKSEEKIYKRPIIGYHSMRGISYPTDLLVYTKEEFERKSGDITTLCYKVKTEGKAIYGKI